ncbi:DUF1365 domain-containing protein [Halioxenophilus aromaticivorans]|uniref:DUF1365 domain-containing protein n=1 Tax=Halioxenophilus aromaticivorans TaxID=1306992 RepID=A0AAV3TYZ2_9ALTE
MTTDNIPSPSHSAIYTGTVWHRRHQPKAHEFSYRVYMAYLDLDELSEVFSRSKYWSLDARGRLWPPVQFRREDFFTDDDASLSESVRRWLQQQTGRYPNGPIRMLANLRCFGYLINPIVCYYVFDDSAQRVEYVIAEVTSTPWQERIQYLVPVPASGQVEAYEFDKSMHVSPFHPMDMKYVWGGSTPCDQLHVSIDNKRNGECVFQAKMALNRLPMTAKNQRKMVHRFPLMTLKVAAAIYWQALKLFVKRVPVQPHPKSIVRNG